MNLFLFFILRSLPFFLSFSYAPFCVPAMHNVLFSKKKKKQIITFPGNGLGIYIYKWKNHFYEMKGECRDVTS